MFSNQGIQDIKLSNFTSIFTDGEVRLSRLLNLSRETGKNHLTWDAAVEQRLLNIDDVW